MRFLEQAQEPVAEFSFLDPAPPVGRIVLVDGRGSHMLDPATGVEDPTGIHLFLWDFHNDTTIDASGSRSGAAVVQHAFQSAGEHPVRLIVEGGPFDLRDEEVRTVEVLPAQAQLFELSATKSGIGEGVVTTDPLGLLLCGSSCASVGPVLLETGTHVTLVATASPGSQFIGWSGTGCVSADSTVAVEMTAARHCVAAFDSDQHTLIVQSTAGGNVASSPAGIDCGTDCSEVYPSGTSVVLTAVSDLGFDFDGWSGCDQATGDQCQVVLTGDRTVTASFSEQPTGFVTLTVIKDGPGTGRVESAGSAEIDCGSDCTGTFTLGETVGLLATPDTGSVFLAWTGCDDADGAACIVTMSTDRTVTATFQ